MGFKGSPAETVHSADYSAIKLGNLDYLKMWQCKVVGGARIDQLVDARKVK